MPPFLPGSTSGSFGIMSLMDTLSNRQPAGDNPQPRLSAVEDISPLQQLLRGALDTATIPTGSPPSEHPRYDGETDALDYDNLLACIRCGACLPVCPTYNTDL